MKHVGNRISERLHLASIATSSTLQNNGEGCILYIQLDASEIQVALKDGKSVTLTPALCGLCPAMLSQSRDLHSELTYEIHRGMIRSYRHTDTSIRTSPVDGDTGQQTGLLENQKMFNESRRGGVSFGRRRQLNYFKCMGSPLGPCRDWPVPRPLKIPPTPYSPSPIKRTSLLKISSVL